MTDEVGSPSRVRSGVPALRGRYPGPLDDGANVLIPVTPSTVGNPGSSPRGSVAGYAREAEIRSTGTQTKERIPGVLSPDSEQNDRTPLGTPARALAARPVLTAEAGAGASDSGRECDCPAWVTRCAHIPNGDLLVLGRTREGLLTLWHIQHWHYEGEAIITYELADALKLGESTCPSSANRLFEDAEREIIYSIREYGA